MSYIRYPASGGGGSGNVVGPASSTDLAIALYDGTTGLLLKNSLATIDAAGKISAVNLKLSGQTISTVPYLDASGNLVSSTTTPTELGYLHGVTSAIQTQLGTKEATANKGVANGYASLDASGLVPITQMSPAALERLVIVADQTARFALTTATVQNGDTVKQTDTGVMYFVVDQTNLGNASGYSVYTAGTASSVAWSGITSIPAPVSSLSGTNTGDQTVNGKTGTTITLTTDDVSEGATNQYFTTARARASFSAGTGISISGGTISATSSGAYAVTGSTGTPQAITAAGGITSGTGQRILQFIAGSGGAVQVTANPQVSAGSTIGQELVLFGTSDTNTVTLADGTGLSLNGPMTFYNNSSLSLIWNGSVWSEVTRRP